MPKQTIKIKPADLEKATIRAFGRSAWEAGKKSALHSKVQLDKKRKDPRYKNRFHELMQ